jgi:hypothetical protein
MRALADLFVTAGTAAICWAGYLVHPALCAALVGTALILMGLGLKHEITARERQQTRDRRLAR